MKTALYYRTDGQPPKELQVLHENGDGTFDLGTAENVIVSRCPVTAEGKPGHCFIAGAIPAAPVEEAEEPAKDADKSGDESKTDDKPDPKGGKKTGKDADK